MEKSLTLLENIKKEDLKTYKSNKQEEIWKRIFEETKK